MQSNLLKVLNGQTLERPPVWFMRQAGRYLPEYRALREKHRMLDLINTPELAMEVTLQPLSRFDLDGAIIFADILNPLMDLGFELDFIQGEGPKIFNPILSTKDIQKIIVPEQLKCVQPTLKAISMCREALSKRSIPLLGFCGAPFTLSAYLIEDGDLGSLARTKRMMMEFPKDWHLLQEKLTDFLELYLVSQVEAGAQALQIFDSWVGYLGQLQYTEFVLPHLQKLIKGIKSRVSVPLIYFSTSTAGIFKVVKEVGADGYSVDWRCRLSDIRTVLGNNVPLQGNLDPMILAGPQDQLIKCVKNLLEEGSKIGPYVFNLGHGIIPQTPPDNVRAVVKLIKGR